MKAKLSLLLLMLVILISCNKKEKPTEQTKEEVNELPYLTYSTLEGEAKSTRTMPGSSILILFNTDCDHCQREAKDIAGKWQAFKNYEVLFITADSVHRISEFARTYELDAKENIKFGRAEYQDVFLNFGSIPTPSIYIYSRERRLVKTFQGETPVEEIIKYL